MDRSCQVTWKLTLLTKVAVGVFISTLPVVAPLGTLLMISVLEATLNVADLPLKVTLVAPVKLLPRITNAAPQRWRSAGFR